MPPNAMTPSDIAATLINLSRELDALVREYKALQEAAAAAKRDAVKAEAAAYLQAAGPVEERKRLAAVEASDAVFASDLAERQVLASREAIRALHTRIEVGRTLSATTRDEIKMIGVGT